MKALQIKSPGHADLINVDDPVPGDGEVLVRVEATASCPQWDLMLMSGKDVLDRPGYPEYPVVPGWPGHEMLGRIEELGSDVKNFSVGDRVVTWRSPWFDEYGYYAERAKIKAENLVPCPHRLPDEKVVSLEMAMCVAVSFQNMPSIEDLRFSVGGLGPSGLIAVQYARTAGAKEVIGFDPEETRRHLGKQLGADLCLDPRSQEAKALLAEPRGSRVDAAVDCTGIKESVQFQMDIAGRWLSLFGVQHDTYHYTLRHMGLNIYAYAQHKREAADYALERILSGELDLAPLITHHLPLTDFVRGTELLRRREAIKICYHPR